MNINNFGRTLIVDRSTSLILLSIRLNEIAKSTVGAILDTYTAQLSDRHLSAYELSLYDGSKWGKISQGIITEYNGVVPEEVNEKRNLAKLYFRGYYLLLEQSNILATSYDNISDLSSYDLPIYLLNKFRYIKNLAEFKNISFEEAEKHLEFLSDSLISLHFRKQTLIWKYGDSLKKVKTEKEFLVWRDALLNETIKIGAV